MTFQFRQAKRSEAKPLIGLYAESGCGKTWSALLLARGFVGPQGRIGMIETEGGRGEANVGRDPVGDYLVCPIRGNFSPQAYGEAITAAEGANLDALIVDSASHEWEGAGGVLSMAADNQANNMKGVLVWQRPKIEHQRNFMLRLMQTPIPLVIVCMRAKYPMIEKPKPSGGKEWVRSEELEPKQADDILFEMFIHGWIDKAHKLHVTKYTIPDVANVIRDGEPITIESGRLLAQWARGGSAAPGPALDPPGAAVTDKTAAEWDVELGKAAAEGGTMLAECWAAIPREHKPTLKAALERRHKPTAAEADATRTPA